MHFVLLCFDFEFVGVIDVSDASVCILDLMKGYPSAIADWLRVECGRLSRDESLSGVADQLL